MKKLATLFLTLVITLAASAADEVLIVRTSGGGETPVEFSQVKEITFPTDGGVNVLLTSGTAISFDAAQFVALTFNTSHSGIEAATDASSLTFNGDTVVSATAGITVYAASGAAVAHTDGTTLSLSALPAGVYIIATQQVTAKIVKK